MMRAGSNVDEVSVVVLGFMLSEGLMDSRVDKLVVMLLFAERENEVPISLEVLVVFKMDQSVFLHLFDLF